MTSPSYPIFLPEESLEIRSDSEVDEDTTSAVSVSAPSSATSVDDVVTCHQVMPDDKVNPCDFVDVRRIIHKIFPHCVSSANDPRVEISQLKGGITNMLLLVKYPNEKGDNINRVLVRAYGNGTSTIIDRDRELATHLHLHSHGLAPTLYARLSNALIYEYIPGKAVEYTDLSRPEIMTAVASRLAEWHHKLDKTVIETEMDRVKAFDTTKPPSTFSRDIYELLEEWINVLPTDTEAQKQRVQNLSQELVWIKATIADKGGPIVVGHCDLLSGNIIVPESWTPGTPTLTSFIDYEYSIPTPRAFDLANHFMEWQGFDCVVELIPEPSVSNPVLRTWARQYLEALTSLSGSSDEITDNNIDSLITEISTWWGLPGFYWGIWAIIQSTISDIDFDYAEYAEKRLSEYYKWKETYQ